MARRPRVGPCRLAAVGEKLSINHLVQAAWMHRSYGYAPRYGYHHGFGGGSWIGHMVVSSIIHGLIYGVIFRVLSHLSLSEMLRACC